MTFNLPEYISYSQWHTYESCPRSWYLSKVRKAQETPTWYMPIGTAVHSMVEFYLTGKDKGDGSFPLAESFFFPLISAQMEIEPDTSKWLAGGSKDDPVVEGKALQLVKDCFERALEFLEDVDVWAVELDASGHLPGLDVELKAFIDLTGEHKKHGPIIIDWKTGSKKPGNFQLETYAALLKASSTPGRFPPGNRKGLYVMLKPGASKARPIDLSAVDPAEVGAKYQETRRKMEAAMIEANKKVMCRLCFNKDNCMEYSGLTKRTLYYDLSAVDQPPY